MEAACMIVNMCQRMRSNTVPPVDFRGFISKTIRYIEKKNRLLESCSTLLILYNMHHMFVYTLKRKQKAGI